MSGRPAPDIASGCSTARRSRRARSGRRPRRRCAAASRPRRRACCSSGARTRAPRPCCAAAPRTRWPTSAAASARRAAGCAAPRARSTFFCMSLRLSRTGASACSTLLSARSRSLCGLLPRRGGARRVSRYCSCAAAHLLAQRIHPRLRRRRGRPGSRPAPRPRTHGSRAGLPPRTPGPRRARPACRAAGDGRPAAGRIRATAQQPARWRIRRATAPPTRPIRSPRRARRWGPWRQCGSGLRHRPVCKRREPRNPRIG